MKKFYAIAALATVLVGCAKEVEDPNVATPETGNMVTLRASVDNPDTKMQADNVGAFAWQTGDVISVLNNSGEAFDFSTTGSGTTVDFTGTFASGSLGDYAMYPKHDDHEASGSTISFHLPTSLDWAANTTFMPMLGKISDGKASFKAVGGVLKLVCYNIPSGAVLFQFSATNKQINGEFLIDGDEASPAIETAVKAGSNNETDIDFTGNYSASKVFYIPLPTGTIDGFTVSFFDSGANELFTKATTANLVVGRNKIILGPSLNCAAVTADDELTNSDITSSSLTGSYSDVAITSATGKTWNVNACKQATSYMQLRATNGSFLQLPSYSDNIASIVLHDTHNGAGNAYSGTLTLSTAKTSGTTITALTPSVSSGDDITITVPSGYSTGYLLTSAVLRVNSITVKFRGASYTEPTITPAETALVIAVAAGDQNTASTTFTYTNPIDDLGVQVLSDKDWATPTITGTGPYTLTVTADKKTDAGARDQAKVTLRATGVTTTITVDQPSAVVDNPSSITVVPQDEAFYATWAPVDNATGFKVYLHDSATGTPATGGTELTPVLEGGLYKVSADGLTNGTEYHLYVKTNTVSANYIAPAGFVEETVTPALPAKGTIGNPYLASEAYDVVAAYASGKGPDGTIYVKGYVSTAYTPSSNTQTYFISDDGTTTKQFEAYKGKGLSGADITESNRVNVGDWVVVCGTAVNYSGTTPEFTDSPASTIITHTPKLSTPTLSLAAGTYYSSQSVTITGPAGATIKYTTDNSTPSSSNGTEYSSAIAIASTTTLKAIAIRDGYLDSEVASATYTISAPTQLVMSDVSCSEQTESSLTFVWTTVANATGYKVSLDNGDTWSDTFTGLTYTWTGLSSSTTKTIKVKAIGTANGQYTDSEPKSANGTTTAPAAVSTPTFSTASGSTVASNLTVTITSATDGSTIYYTTNGDTPTVGGATTTAGTAGSASVEITVKKTIKAIAVKGEDVSSVATATYTLRHTDTITASMLAATSTTYTDFSSVIATDASKSSAVYAGQSAKDSSGNIQLRSKNSNSGIVSTTSGGTLVSVTINVSSGSNTVDVYGNTSAYSDASGLYGSGNGTKIGSTSSTGTIDCTGGNYQYVGIRSNNGAVYLSSVVIVWDE